MALEPKLALVFYITKERGKFRKFLKLIRNDMDGVMRNIIFVKIYSKADRHENT